ncbi:unnamed protein product, partial [Rotaria socialis]
VKLQQYPNNKELYLAGKTCTFAAKWLDEYLGMGNRLNTPLEEYYFMEKYIINFIPNESSSKMGFTDQKDHPLTHIRSIKLKLLAIMLYQPS